MPLRDHINPPLDDYRSWDELQGMWPAVIVTDLSRKLPAGYYAAPNIRLGSVGEVDVGALETSGAVPASLRGSDAQGLATAVYAPPKPAILLAGLPGQDKYEVFVYDVRRGRRLVAAIEILSP